MAAADLELRLALEKVIIGIMLSLLFSLTLLALLCGISDFNKLDMIHVYMNIDLITTMVVPSFQHTSHL